MENSTSARINLTTSASMMTTSASMMTTSASVMTTSTSMMTTSASMMTTSTIMTIQPLPFTGPDPRFRTNVSDFLRDLSDQKAWELAPVIGYIAFLMLVGAIGNILVMYVHIFKFKPSSTRTFVISLAAFDLMCCLIAMPGEILDIRFSYTYTVVASCKMLRFISSFVSVASGITLMAVSFDRYKRICRPLTKQIGHKQAWYAVVVSAVASVTISWPLLVLSGPKTVDTGVKNITGFECSVSDNYKKTNYPLIYTIVLFFVFMSAFVTMIIAYSLIGRAILRQSSFRKSMMVASRTRNATTCSTLSECDRIGVPVRKMSTTSVNKVCNEENQISVEQASDYSIAALSSGDRNGVPNRTMSLPTIRTKSKTAEDNRTIKTTMMLFLISLIFLLSFLPHLVLKARQAINKHFLEHAGVGTRIVYNIFVRSFLINSVSNAFIYGFCSPRFRRECKNICKTLARKRSFSLNSNSYNYA